MIIPAEIASQLPTHIQHAHITALVRLSQGMGGGAGETCLIAHKGELVVLSRSSSAEPFTLYPVSPTQPPRLEKKGADSTLLLTTRDRKEYRFPLFFHELEVRQPLDALSASREERSAPASPPPAAEKREEELFREILKHLHEEEPEHSALAGTFQALRQRRYAEATSALKEAASLSEHTERGALYKSQIPCLEALSRGESIEAFFLCIKTLSRGGAARANSVIGKSLRSHAESYLSLDEPDAHFYRLTYALLWTLNKELKEHGEDLLAAYALSLYPYLGSQGWLYWSEYLVEAGEALNQDRARYNKEHKHSDDDEGLEDTVGPLHKRYNALVEFLNTLREITMYSDEKRLEILEQLNRLSSVFLDRKKGEAWRQQLESLRTGQEIEVPEPEEEPPPAPREAPQEEAMPAVAPEESRFLIQDAASLTERTESPERAPAAPSPQYSRWLLSGGLPALIYLLWEILR